MPKSTFYNLHKDKQHLILSAAREEFTRVPLNQASIAQIIKKAEIPRGSFYQYFEDKNDLFIEIARQESKKKFELFNDIFKVYDGDILKTIEVFVKNTIENLEMEENKSLQKNIFISMDEKMRNRMTPHHKGHPCRDEFRESIEFIARENIGLEEYEFSHMCKMVSGIIFGLFAHYLNDLATKEECLDVFEFELDIIKRGIKSRKEDREEILN